MDQIWLAAPGPAIKLWPETGAARWRLNASALLWSRGHGLDDPALCSLAEQLLAEPRYGASRSRSQAPASNR